MTLGGAREKVAPCPDCGLRMYKKDFICPHCNHALTPQEQDFLNNYQTAERQSAIKSALFYIPIGLLILYLLIAYG